MWRLKQSIELDEESLKFRGKVSGSGSRRGGLRENENVKAKALALFATQSPELGRG